MKKYSKIGIFKSKGRIIKESLSKYRSPFQRDRDRIIHCASFRRFNPSSGVWMTEAEWKGEIIEERIASSDYSRSGWCPGSKVTPEIIELGKLEKGEHSITISIPEAQITTEEFFNFWNISAYIIY